MSERAGLGAERPHSGTTWVLLERRSTLTAIGFSGVIGSGWLLGALYAAQYAGPEGLLSWVIGGVVLALIALVMAALGGARPEAGGLVRWPYYSSGRFVATIAGWGIWIAWATNPPSESAAMIQYMWR